MGMGAEVGIEIGINTLKVEGDATKLFEMLAKAQAEFLDVPRVDDGQVGNDRKFKYAGYATLVKCVRPALNKYGIALIQPLHSLDGKAITTTILAGHGARIETSFAFHADYVKADKYGGKKDDCQEFGRSHTYYRRYQLQSILGIEGDDDADSIEAQRARREDQAQFSEPARDATTGEAVPAKKETKPAAAPKANGASAAKSSAPASAEKTTPSAAQSAPTTTPTKEAAKPAEAKPAEAAPKLHGIDTIPPEKLNDTITSAMRQQNPPWKMIQLREFYANHISPEEMPKPDAMPPELKRQILTKMVEVTGVAPF